MEANRELENATHGQHLSDEQFTELLLGTSPSSVREHLKLCPQCRAEAERVSGAIGNFEQQSRLWAERRAAALTLRIPERRPAFAWLLRPQVWTSAALAMALAAGIGITLHRDHERTAQLAAATRPAKTTAQPAAKLTTATLKADNALLSAIDGELSADESTPASVYGLNAASHGARTKSSKRISN